LHKLWFKVKTELSCLDARPPIKGLFDVQTASQTPRDELTPSPTARGQAALATVLQKRKLLLTCYKRCSRAPHAARIVLFGLVVLVAFMARRDRET
jgi:hypothetical protein